MANAATHRHLLTPGASLTIPLVMRLTWISWVVMLVVPFLCFLWVLWVLGGSGEGAVKPVNQHSIWFLAASAYLLVCVPAAFFWRGHVFKAYWTGQPVAPDKYLYGMLSIWVALEVGGIFSLLGCVIDKSLLPNLLPALVAFMFYVTLWPSGRAMVRRVGHAEDPAVYEEPR